MMTVSGNIYCRVNRWWRCGTRRRLSTRQIHWRSGSLVDDQRLAGSAVNDTVTVSTTFIEPISIE
jgi:hypothetical protein